MGTSKISDKHLAAKLAHQYYEKEITFFYLLENYPKNTEDIEIENLLDLIIEQSEKFSVEVDHIAIKKLTHEIIELLENK